MSVDQRKVDDVNLHQMVLKRWINAQIKSIGKTIDNLQVDLSDGSVLIELVQKLSTKRIRKFAEDAQSREDKLANVRILFLFLKGEHLTLESISPAHIVDGDICEIETLIWTIILHYGITKSSEWDNADRKSNETAHHRLLVWIQSKIPTLSISNFTTDWCDGIALGALVDSIAPGLCPDWKSWMPKNPITNSKEAMSLAEYWLNVQLYVTPDELISKHLDDKSMIVYLSQYLNAKIRSGAPLRAKRSSNRIIAYGPGVEPVGPIVGSPVSFTVETVAAGRGSIDVTIRTPYGSIEKADVRFNHDKNLSYTVSYMPKTAGIYKIYVKFLGKDIPNSPFHVDVAESVGDVTKVIGFGPGLQPDGVYIGRTTYFDIMTKGAGTGTPEVIILDPAGHKTTVPAKLRQIEQDLWRCEYTSAIIGLHSVNVFFGGEPIKCSPFGVKISPISDPKKVRVRGRGIQARGIRCGDDADFYIYTEGAGVGTPEVKIVGPGGVNQNVSIQQTNDTSFECHYFPSKEGRYIIMCKFAKEDIPKAPFEVIIGPRKQSPIIAYGPGLRGGVVGYAAAFVVETNGEVGALGFSVAGPSQAEIECHDNGDGSALVKYLPTVAGDYAVHILCDNDDIPQSPYIAHILPKGNYQPESVKCTGPGVEPNGAIVGKTCEFVVDVKSAGTAAPLQVKIQDIYGRECTASLLNRQDGIIHCSYVPREALPHTVEVNYGAVAAAHSPYRVYVRSPPDLSKLIIWGNWFDKEATVHKAMSFTVDATSCGEGALEVHVTHEASKTEIPVKIINSNNVYTVEVIPTRPGKYITNLIYGGFEVPVVKNVFVDSIVDVSKVVVQSVKTNVGTGHPTDFFIDASKAGYAINEKHIQVTIMDRSGERVSPNIAATKDEGIYKVTYTPLVVGRHTIELAYENKPLPSSPYVIQTVMPCEPSLCKATGPGLEGGTTREVCKFVVDTKAAGVGGLTLAIEGPSETSLKYMDDKHGSCFVEYVPTEPGDYEITIIFGQTHIPGSPFKVTICDPINPDKVKVTGPAVDGAAVYVGELTYFNVDVSQAGPGLVGVTLNNVQGMPVENVKVENDGDGLYSVYFVPPVVGMLMAYVKFAHQDVPSSPFVISVFPREITSIDSSTQTNAKRLSTTSYLSDVADVQKETTRKSDVVSLGFQSDGNDENVDKENNNSVDRIESNDHFNSQSNGNQSENVYATSRFRQICFNNISLPLTGNIQAEVKMPSGKVDLPRIEDNRDGTVRIQYDPREEGIHELVVLHNGAPIKGSPYRFHVDSISTGSVTAYGPGLETGRSGEPCKFTISTKGAGGGGLSLSVEGPSKANISYNDNKDGTVGVTYLPTEPGDYKVSVRFGDKHIKGSPYTAKIIGVQKRNQVSIESCSSVTLPGLLTDADLKTLNAIIQTPKGLEEPCFLKRLPSGNIGISFTPREAGEHTVTVKRLGVPVKNSPFKVTVNEREVGNAKKVKTSGAALKEGKTQAQNTFTVDTREAGYGGLSLSIEGPSKAEIKCFDKPDGTLDISYKPSEPGNYILNLKYADNHVVGSPFTIKIDGSGANRQRENIQHQREPIPSADVGNECKLTFKMRGITSFDIAATVTSPSGVTEDAEVNEVEDGLYAVHFVPREEGVHTVSVKYTELHIPGSPFQFTVGPYGDSGSHLVKSGGIGLQRGEVGVPCEFNVWTREAGGGPLAISVEGPSKAEILFKDRKDGSCNVAYTVKEPGEYYVGLKFNDRHIPDSPYRVIITPSDNEARKVEVAQFPQGTVQADTPSQFLVRKNGARGELEARIIAPSNTEDDCFVQSIDADEYSIRFYPREHGIHTIHVKFNGVHIPGSPYHIKVGKDVADPAVVTAEGSGFKDIVTGRPAYVLVNTCDAGVGSLSVTLDGPSKVAMDCSEIETGYKVRYTPLLPGEYYMSIKYNNIHIIGSPFKINCTGKKLVAEGAQESSNVTLDTVEKVSKKQRSGPLLPIFKADSTKVTVKGMGLKKAFLGKQNQFQVNATEAGHSILFVGLYNPKGPCEEVQVKHTGKNTFTVNYYIRERGEYTLIVMWGDSHIPGSPFSVEVPTK